MQIASKQLAKIIFIGESPFYRLVYNPSDPCNNLLKGIIFGMKNNNLRMLLSLFPSILLCEKHRHYLTEPAVKSFTINDHEMLSVSALCIDTVFIQYNVTEYRFATICN